MTHKNYEKKSYRVFSRKDDKTTKFKKSLKNTCELKVNQFKNGLVQSKNSISNENKVNNGVFGMSQEQQLLLEQLSSKYCMCDSFEEQLNYSSFYSNLLEISSMI